MRAASNLHTSDDMDDVVFQNIIRARSARGELGAVDEDGDAVLEHGHDDTKLIPESRATNCVDEAGRELTEDEAKPHEQIEDRLFDVLMHTDVVQGVDAGGAPRKMRVDTSIVRMTIPGGDAGLLINCLRNSMPGIVLPLTNILSHMALSLRLPSSGVNLNEIFSPGVRNNISLLTAEAQMVPAVFNVAMHNEIHNVVFRGIVYDPRSPREVRVYARMLEGVIAARAKHFRIVTLGCNRDTRPTFKKQDTPMVGFGACALPVLLRMPLFARPHACSLAPSHAHLCPRPQARRSSSTAACTSSSSSGRGSSSAWSTSSRSSTPRACASSPSPSSPS